MCFEFLRNLLNRNKIKPEDLKDRVIVTNSELLSLLLSLNPDNGRNSIYLGDYDFYKIDSDYILKWAGEWVKKNKGHSHNESRDCDKLALHLASYVHNQYNELFPSEPEGLLFGEVWNWFPVNNIKGRDGHAVCIYFDTNLNCLRFLEPATGQPFNLTEVLNSTRQWHPYLIRIP
jgi:hypothetical protein